MVGHTARQSGVGRRQSQMDDTRLPPPTAAT